MGYKDLGNEMSFAELAVSKSLEHNRSLKMMNRINKVVNWRNIEALLQEYYEVGTSKEGADAYPPLMLLKCFLLQKWFPLRPGGLRAGRCTVRSRTGESDK